MREQQKSVSPSTSSEESSYQAASIERKRRGSKDILEFRAAAQAGKKKRRPQDQLNPFFEHRSWCAWISKESRDCPVGWKVLLDLLVSHHQRLQESKASKTGRDLHLDLPKFISSISRYEICFYFISIATSSFLELDELRQLR